MADAGGGVLEGLGHEADASHAGEKEDAVAEIFPLHEEIDGEDDDDTEGSDGLEEFHDEFGGGVERASVGIDDSDGLGFCEFLLLARRGGSGAGCEVSADALECGDGAFQERFERRVDGGNFALDAGPVLGQVSRDVEKLAGDDVADCGEDDEGEDAGDGDCGDARDAAALKAADGRGEQKCEGEGKGEGDDEFAREVKDEDGYCEHK